MKLSSYEWLMYLGTLDEPRNISEVARTCFPENVASVRSSISRKDADSKLVEEGLIKEQKRGGWKYKADSEKLGSLLADLIQEKMDISEEDRDRIEKFYSQEITHKLFHAENLQNFNISRVSKFKSPLSIYAGNVYLNLALARKACDGTQEDFQNYVQFAGSLQNLIFGFLIPEEYAGVKWNEMMENIEAFANEGLMPEEAPLIKGDESVDKGAKALQSLKDVELEDE